MPDVKKYKRIKKSANGADVDGEGRVSFGLEHDVATLTEHSHSLDREEDVKVTSRSVVQLVDGEADADGDIEHGAADTYSIPPPRIRPRSVSTKPVRAISRENAKRCAEEAPRTSSDDSVIPARSRAASRGRANGNGELPSSEAAPGSTAGGAYSGAAYSGTTSSTTAVGTPIEAPSGRELIKPLPRRTIDALSLLADKSQQYPCKPPACGTSMSSSSSSPSLAAMDSLAPTVAEEAAAFPMPLSTSPSQITMESLIDSGPKPRVVRSASSLKALSSAVLLDHVDLFRGLDNPSSHVELPPEVLKKLLTIMTTVRRISDENLPFFLTEHYRELAIDVRGSPGALTDASLSLIPVCCPDLNELAFKNCSALSRGGVDALCKNACVGLANSLTSLSFVACPGICNDCVRLFATNFRDLTSLSLRGCVNLNSEGFRVLGEHSGHMLRSLDVSDINLSSTSVNIIADMFCALEELNLSVRTYNPKRSYCDVHSLKAVAQHCGRTLKSICLSGLPFNDEVIAALAEHAPDIEEVDFSWPDPRSPFTWSVKITDEALMALAAHCRDLKSLGLAYCHRITDRGMSAIGMRCTKLEKVNLEGLTSLTDKAFMAIALPAMRMLKLRGCFINSCTLFALAQRSQYLEYLDARGPSFPSEASFMELAEECANLEVLLGSENKSLMHKLKTKFPRLIVELLPARRPGDTLLDACVAVWDCDR